jgi:hypothetical protein
MRRLDRRGFLRSGGLALGGALGLASGFGRVLAEDALPWTPIGFTQLGEPLVVHHLGNGRNRLFIMGGQHGWPEENTVRLARGLMSHFVEHPEEVPGGVGIDFMPLGNPDGYALGSRQYYSGVDPNRNWGGADWSADAYDSNGRFRLGLGGGEPFSEQETRALRDWLAQTRPVLMINYHSMGGFMFGGGEVADAYADASGYTRPQPRPPGSPGGGGSSVLGYRASGTTNGWLRTIGIGSIFIELSNSVSAELDRNLAGVRAALRAMTTSATA